MIRKILTALLTMALLICVIPLAVTAEIAPPALISAPEHFGVSYYYNDSMYFTFSAPEDLRSYIEKWKTDDENNHTSMTVYFQIDYRIDKGDWHHTSDWDSPKTVPDEIDSLYFVFGSEGNYNSSERWSLSALFPEDKELIPFHESGWEYLKNHAIAFRTRFSQSFDYGETFVLSPWSKEFTLSAGTKEDYDKLINNAPSLVSAELKAKPDGEPYFHVRLGRIPGDIQYLHALSGGSVRTEVWMRRGGDKEFKKIFYEWADEETLKIEASDYFSVDGAKQSYDAESYEIKARYSLDLRNYKQSGRDGDIYGPFSNVISRNMPAWSDASKWAVEELKKADDEGLIPDILKGANLTKPITREEFAELAVKLYEKSTGKAAIPSSPNPFPDTSNPEILKAYKLGVTTGISTAKGLVFSPDDLINREQCATMLYRTLKTIVPEGNYSIAGIKDFPDQKHISSWAVEGTKYMSKLGIIKGDNNGNFMPKAVTSAQEASGYGAATREAAILMSVRSYEQLDTIRSGKPAATPEPVPADAGNTSSGTGTGTGNTGNTSNVGNTGNTGNTGSAELKDMNKWIIGIWTYGQSSGNVGFFESIEFKNDGTFDKGVGTIVNQTRSATGFTGKYKIYGDKLTLYDQFKSQSRTATEVNRNYWALIIGQDQYKDIPVDDVEYQITRTNDDELSMNTVVDGTPVTIVFTRVNE